MSHGRAHTIYLLSFANRDKQKKKKKEKVRPYHTEHIEDHPLVSCAIAAERKRYVYSQPSTSERSGCPRQHAGNDGGEVISTDC